MSIILIFHDEGPNSPSSRDVPTYVGRPTHLKRVTIVPLRLLRSHVSPPSIILSVQGDPV